MICGNCHQPADTVADVRFCFAVGPVAPDAVEARHVTVGEWAQIDADAEAEWRAEQAAEQFFESGTEWQQVQAMYDLARDLEADVSGFLAAASVQ